MTLDRKRDGIGEDEGRAIADALLSSRLFGTGLPEQAATLLRLAGESYADEPTAEHCLNEARRLAPDHPAVLIGLYRFYFYKNRLFHALAIACLCLNRAARDCGLSQDWRRVRAGDAAFGDFEALLPRFYMFCLKGYAYLQLRTGDYGEGRDAIEKLLELDPADRINARLLLDVLQRAGHDDE